MSSIQINGRSNIPFYRFILPDASRLQIKEILALPPPEMVVEAIFLCFERIIVV